MAEADPSIVVAAAIAIAVEIGAPIVLAVLLVRRLAVPWRFWWFGVLVFLVSQVLTRIPLLTAVQLVPTVRQALEEPVLLWAWLLIVGSFTAGLFEEGGRLLAYRYLFRPADRTWSRAVVMGAGHGGLESIGIGLLVLGTLVAYLAVMTLPPETFAGAAEAIEEARSQFAELRGWHFFFGAWERLCVLPIHIAFSVLVLQSFHRGFRWWWYAVAAHTVVNFATVSLLRIVTNRWGTLLGMMASEALVFLFALAALLIVFRLRDEPPDTLQLADESSPIA